MRRLAEGWDVTDKMFLWAIVVLQAFLGWRQWTTPPGQRAIEFMPLEVFAIAFTVSAVAVACFILRPTTFWRTVSGGAVVIAVSCRAVAVLFAGYADQVIPLSRAQTGFAAWMLGAVLATFVWTHIRVPRGG